MELVDRVDSSIPLPAEVKQKYPWSCKIAGAAVAVSALLRRSITEDDVLDKLKSIGICDDEPLSMQIPNDRPDIVVNRGAPTLIYWGLSDAILKASGGRVRKYIPPSPDSFFPTPDVLDEDGAIIVPQGSNIVDRASDKADFFYFRYTLINAALQSGIVVEASGNRREVNGLKDISHHFIVSATGKDSSGEIFVKVLDSNFHRQRLEPSYWAPLRLFNSFELYALVD